jgi:CBS domain-containing protein
VSSVSRHDQEFDFSTPPFNLLTAEQARQLGTSMDIEFIPKGTTVLEAGGPSRAVYVIMKGAVTAFVAGEDSDRVFAEFGPHDVFGTTASLTGRARYTYETDEDTLAWTIPAEAFRSVVSDNGRFAAYFLESFAKRSMEADESAGASDLAEMMLTRVGDALLGEAVRVPEDCRLDEATRRMREQRVDCVFVEGPAGRGIVTRTDLLEAIALGQRGLEQPVGSIASRPVVGCDVSEPLFQALVVMTRRGIERIAVLDEEELKGTLGLAELLSHYSSHSHVIGLQVSRASSREELANAARQVNRLVGTLHATGAKMEYLADLVSALNQRLLKRLFEFSFEDPLRNSICLLVLGSEGRGEQLLKTDQDNALVLGQGITDEAVADGAQRFSEGLAGMGYPPCPGGVMVSNPKWRGDVERWLKSVRRISGDNSPEAQMRAAIMFDARVAGGDARLFEPVREALFALARNELWLHHFITPALEFQTPLRFLGGLIGREAPVDLKKGGIFPVVHGVRTLAAEQGLRVTSTFERIDALIERGVLSKSLGTNLRQSYGIMLRLRLGQQLQELREGEVPTNRVRFAQLRRLDRDLLRDALGVVREFQSFLSARYHRGM